MLVRSTHSHIFILQTAHVLDFQKLPSHVAPEKKTSHFCARFNWIAPTSQPLALSFLRSGRFYYQVNHTIPQLDPEFSHSPQKNLKKNATIFPFLHPNKKSGIWHEFVLIRSTCFYIFILPPAFVLDFQKPPLNFPGEECVQLLHLIFNVPYTSAIWC